MDESLTIIGNHSLHFKGRKYSEVRGEVEALLNGLAFKNADYLRLYALDQANGAEPDVHRIHIIKTQTEWKCQDEDPECWLFEKVQYLIVEGPFNLKLYIHPYVFLVYGPNDSYEDWTNEKHPQKVVFRNEWRKLFFALSKTFGGNQVYYTADSNELFFEKEPYLISFSEIKPLLIENYGQPGIASFSGLANGGWIIDNLDDINWDMQHPLEQFLPEPDDFTTTDFDLSQYDTKEKVMAVDWENLELLHKKEGDAVWFYKIAHLKGLFLKHYGVVGGKEQIEVLLDKYAYTNFERIWERLYDEGYLQGMAKFFLISFKESPEVTTWEQAFEELDKLLRWDCNGHTTFLSINNGPHHYYIRAADVKLALQQFKMVLEKYNIQTPLEVKEKNGFSVGEVVFHYP